MAKIALRRMTSNKEGSGMAGEPSGAQKKGNFQAVTEAYSCQRSRRHWLDIESGLQIEGGRKQETMEAALVGTLIFNL